MGNTLYVDKNPQKIDQLTKNDQQFMVDLPKLSLGAISNSKPAFNLNLKEDKNKSFLKAWKLSQNQSSKYEDKLYSIVLEEAYNFLTKKEKLNLSCNESYIILLVHHAAKQEDFQEKVKLTESILELAESTKDITNRGLEYAFATNIVSSSLLQENNSNEHKYVLFIWNGINSSEAIKSQALLKAYELDHKLRTNDYLKTLFRNPSDFVQYSTLISDDDDTDLVESDQKSNLLSKVSLLRYLNSNLNKRSKTSAFKNFKQVFCRGQSSETCNNYYKLFQNDHSSQRSLSKEEQRTNNSRCLEKSSNRKCESKRMSVGLDQDNYDDDELSDIDLVLPKPTINSDNPYESTDIPQNSKCFYIKDMPKAKTEISITKIKDFTQNHQNEKVTNTDSKICSEILPKKLYLSGEIVASDFNALKSNEITHIINSASEVIESYFPDKFKYLNLYLRDNANEVSILIIYKLFLEYRVLLLPGL